MLKFRAFLALLTLLASCLAFETTVPLLFWSPKRLHERPIVSSQVILSGANVFETALKSLSSQLCGVKIVVVFDQPGIHSTDLSRSAFSDSTALLRKHSKSADYFLQIPYVSDTVDVEKLARSIVDECHGELVQIDAAEITLNLATAQVDTYVILMTLPSPNEQDHKESFSQSDIAIGALISAVTDAVQDSYSVIYTSGAAKGPSVAKRSANLKRLLMRRAPNDTASLPLFQKYQFFTAGINMVIGVSLLFVTILIVGVTWVGSIQTPVRFEGKVKRA
ncbi:hypothetical protein BC937DRAFT_95043 [Endogone sp. FLAS-F59071]|nr:hypothetical protein BC937DRAFT_95043 [Endogone sp. FLAS-F59071]|eukprot:RUS20505.1 hypothetical protein BC937DRAFT_95043 [Endogone sp. FLAS-F59071]